MVLMNWYRCCCVLCFPFYWHKMKLIQIHIWFHLKKNKHLYCIQSGSTCKEVTTLCHHIHTAAQNINLLGVLWFYPASLLVQETCEIEWNIRKKQTNKHLNGLSQMKFGDERKMFAEQSWSHLLSQPTDLIAICFLIAEAEVTSWRWATQYTW